MPARVQVRTTSGATYEECILDPKGSAGAPLSSADIDDKFRSQVNGVLSADACDRLLGALRSVDKLDDVSTLFPMLVSK